VAAEGPLKEAVGDGVLCPAWLPWRTVGRLLLIVVTALVVVGCTGPAPGPAAEPGPTAAPESSAGSGSVAGDHERVVTVDGRERSYVVHVPAGRVDGPVPVVVVLHGGGGNARNAMEQTGMSELADRAGFLAVYPNGSGRLGRTLLTWNAGPCCGYAVDERVDDVAFVAAVLDGVERDFGGDPERIFVTGMSNGAMMSYRLACELSGRIAAIAPVAGSMPAGCRPSAPVSVVAFHGTADKHVLYDGGAPIIRGDTHPRQDAPVADTIAFWVGHNGCADPVTEDVSPDTRRLDHTCPDGSGVTLYTITGGGHAWPGGVRGRDGADRPTDTISATELMWEFFRRTAPPR
jgi:polyhydroxybutyrate depolymerase